jgi:protein-S-isoprenylcysteine O-methyltransferase Ste14
MYLGYIVLVLGGAMAGATILGMILAIAFTLLTVYRARIEEEALGSFSEEYREYAARTGFLIPGVGCQAGAGRSRPS